MSLARAITLGARLKARLGVNGSQNASRSLVCAAKAAAVGDAMAEILKLVPHRGLWPAPTSNRYSAKSVHPRLSISQGNPPHNPARKRDRDANVVVLPRTSPSARLSTDTIPVFWPYFRKLTQPYYRVYTTRG